MNKDNREAVGKALVIKRSIGRECAVKIIRLIVHLEGGIVQDITLSNGEKLPSNIVVEIRDYDTEGCEDEGIVKLGNGREYYSYKH